MRKSLGLRRPVQRAALAVAGCLALLPLTAPSSAARPVTARAAQAVASTFSPLGRERRDQVFDPVYLVQANSGRGATFEVYSGWDYALLTNEPGNGTPLVFTRDDQGNFTITSTSSNWGGYRTWCMHGTDIRLEKSDCSTRWEFVPAEGDLFYIKVVGKNWRIYTTFMEGKKRWLAADNNVFNVQEEFVKFRVVHP